MTTEEIEAEIQDWQLLKHNSTSITKTDDLSPTERKAMSIIINGMARGKYKWNPKAKINAATGSGSNSIKVDIELNGHSLTDDTIRTYINQCSEEASKY